MSKCNFIEIALWHGFSPVNLLHIFKTPFLKNTHGWLLLELYKTYSSQKSYSDSFQGRKRNIERCCNLFSYLFSFIVSYLFLT